MTAPLHQPFYCEENIWHLAQDPRCGPGERRVAVIMGGDGHVAVWGQRAAGRAGAPILWDYHVVLLVRGDAWMAWDLDSLLPLPTPAAAWLAASFPAQDRVPAGLRPLFRLMAAADYVAHLATDRAHMRDRHGRWREPPPPWPAPGDGRPPTLGSLIDPYRPAPGAVLDLAGMARALG